MQRSKYMKSGDSKFRRLVRTAACHERGSRWKWLLNFAWRSPWVGTTAWCKDSSWDYITFGVKITWRRRWMPLLLLNVDCMQQCSSRWTRDRVLQGAGWGQERYISTGSVTCCTVPQWFDAADGLGNLSTKVGTETYFNTLNLIPRLQEAVSI